MRTVIVVVSFVAYAILGAGSGVSAGDLFGGNFGGGSGCNCGGSSPVIYAAPVVSSGCGCCQAAAGCCGMGGGLAQIGGVYGLQGFHAHSGHGSGLHSGQPGFLSGYEGLPNMDGGGVHYRYPYHSYRRPWAHPGTPSTNISIVW